MIIENAHKLKEFILKPDRFGYVYYLLYDNEVMYVGKTGSVEIRIPAHKDKTYNKVLYKRVLLSKLSYTELQEISKYCPIYNVNGVPKTAVKRLDFKMVIEFDSHYAIRGYNNIDKRFVYRKDDNLLIILSVDENRFHGDTTTIMYLDLGINRISKEIEIKHTPDKLVYNSETHSLEPLIESVFDKTQPTSFKNVVYCDKGFDTRFEYFNKMKKEQQEFVNTISEIERTKEL